ncbi:MAG TPA: SusC/RagA family TonB-linked outer membrane protein [Bacteroidales bacterium]|nr:SusC/RagA family TonB-linked outer membrane protein [Bacteroidales bacterium]
MRKITILLALLLFAGLQSAFAQKTITGKITSAEDGLAMPGVPVVIKGTTVGTTTDANGAFTLKNVPSNATLLVSFIGMIAQEIPVGNQTEFNISMQSDMKALGDVVVTALGIQRDKKTLTYASQQVSATDIRIAGNTNFMDGLAGKASGLDIKMSSSGAGGSTKAVLRGNKSLVGLSEPLYVIDGIPYVNNKGGQPGSYGGTDQGDGLSALNNDDIESVNVLKGSNASILYGSQGANGVVIITTKKGKAGKVDVSINSITTFDQVSGLPEFQFKYGAAGGSDYSWSTTPGKYQDSYIKDFFQTGISAINSVSISGGNEKTTAYFSYSNTSAKGVMPTNTYNKHNFSFNQSTKLFNDKLTISSNVMFANEVSKNRPGAGYYNNPLTGLYLFARERDFRDYRYNFQTFNKDRNLYQMYWYSTEEKMNNPYWEIYKNPKLNEKYRVVASLKASWDIAKGLKFDIRGNIDYADNLHDYRYAAGGNSVSVSPNGKYDYSKTNDKAVYTDAILSYNTKISDFTLNAIAGFSYQENILNNGMSVNNGTTSLMYPNVFTFANMPYNIMFNQSIDRVIKEGLFGNVQLGWKEMLFLDLSGRNDWASTLALTGNESYFYPAAGLTAIISNMVTLPEFISFAKVRGSLSQTSNEVPFNRVNPWNSIGGTGTPTQIGGITRNTQVPFTNLKPETITGTEVGAEMRFFKGRAGFEFTYYQDISKNQFLSLAAPSGSGYSTYYINAGKITNNGFELTVDVTPVETSDFRWNSSVNLSQNKNKINELISSNPNYYVGGDDEGFASIIKAGGSYNDIWIYKFARDEQGRIILSDKGNPTKTKLQEKVGNANPDYVLGWNNNFNYKNFFGSFLINGKFGGIAFSKTEAFLDSYGVSKRTGDLRDAGTTMAIDAVQGTTAVSQIKPYDYFTAVGDRNRIMEPYVFKRTNVRLAQFVIGYNLPCQKLGLPLKAASVSFVGRNLFFFYKDAPYDPEQTMSTSNSMQSNEVFSMPAVRSYGFNVKLNF